MKTVGAIREIPMKSVPAGIDGAEGESIVTNLCVDPEVQVVESN
jgi:hypothetical protein